MMNVTRVLFLLFAVTYVLLVEAQQCPHGWLDRPGSTTCYSFRFKQKKSWTEARLECQQYDGELLKIETDNEKVWVQTQVRHIEDITFGNVEWWTGLNNREKGDVTKWVWADGDALEPGVLQWSPGEPNNYMGQEHCAEIWLGIFNDTNCDRPLYYICERPKKAVVNLEFNCQHLSLEDYFSFGTTGYIYSARVAQQGVPLDKSVCAPLSCDVDSGWEHLGGNCYKSMPIRRNYQDATYACTQYDASLVDIFNEEMQQLVTDLAKQYGRNSWLGLHVVNESDGNMVLEWTNGSSLVKTWWSESEISNHTLSDTSSCVMLNVTKNGLQNWEYAECMEESNFICTKQSGLCSDGWVQKRGQCYFFSQKTMTWKDSVAFCNLRGAALIQMNGGDNMQFLSTELRENFGQDVDSMWLGISGKNGSWSWLSGDAANITSPMWAADASKADTSGLTKCAYIMRDDRDLKWQISADCLTDKGVICTAASNVPVQPPPAVFPELRCQDNWLAGRSNCFKVNTAPVTWFEARMKCQQDGGDLAVIASEQDQKFLSKPFELTLANTEPGKGHIQQEVWIGLNDREQENNFVWLDQDDQFYLTYWKSGEPHNNILGNMYSENCVAMGTSIGSQDHGKWIDYPCALKLGFICQKMAVRNIAAGKTANQSSTYLMHMASFAVDNNIGYNLTDNSMCSHTTKEFNPWWEVDLGTQYNIGSVIIHRRIDCKTCLHSQQDLRILLKNDASETGIMIFQDQHHELHAVITAEVSLPIFARYVRIEIPLRKTYLTLCEVEVFEATPGQQSQSTTAATEMMPSNSTGCGVGWIWSPETGHCYRKGHDKLTWTDAREACRSWEATLVPVQSLEEGRFLAGMPQCEENFWIGVSAIPGDSSVWLTVDRKTLSFSNWGTGEPSYEYCGLTSGEHHWLSFLGRLNRLEDSEFVPCHGRAYCALEDVPAGTWHAVNCLKRESYICLKRDEAVPVCSDGWIADHDIKTCYKFEKNLKNWHEAESACETWNSHLVSFASDEEYNFVIDTAQKEGMSGDIWIGLHDITVENKWEWSDGTSFLWKKWNSKQPDDWKGIEDCGGVTYNHLMNDYFCTEKFMYVCERPALVSAACDHGWELDPNTGICFKVGDENKPWSEARATCQKFGGDLANVQSPDEHLYIYNRVHGITDSHKWWIWAFDTGTEKGADSLHSYTDWVEDNDNDEEEHCAYIWLGPSLYHGRKNNAVCTSLFPYICHKSVSDLRTPPRTKTTTTFTTTTSTKEEKTPTSTSEDDYYNYDQSTSTTMVYYSRCGYLWEVSHFEEFCYQINDFLATWQDARTKCQQDGGDLLSITSENEQSYITELLRYRTAGLGYWMGANILGTVGGWRWSNGDPYFYFDWTPGEPNDNDGEDCAIMGGSLFLYRWNEFKCGSKLGYICKKKASQIMSTVIPSEKPTSKPETGSLGCYQNWHEYGSRCYLFVQDKTDWNTALKSCRRQGGDLASVANQEEQNFIFSQIPRGRLKRRVSRSLWFMDDYETELGRRWSNTNQYSYFSRTRAPVDGFWIGMSMSDRQTAKLLQWSDNSKVTFTTWSENEPNNYHDQESVCVTLGLQTGLWTDRHCSNDMPGYICEMERISINFTSLLPFAVGCPYDNSLGYGSICYQFVTNGKSWNNAQEYCVKKGGNLAIITDRYSQAFLSSELVNKSQNYWVGLRKRNDTRMYQWVNGDAVTYTLWNKNFTGNEDVSCVSMRTYRPFGLWETENCSSILPYICQMPRDGFIQSTLPTTAVTNRVPCTSGWTPLNRFCYKISRSEETWFEARASCQKQGADLTSIMDDAENMLIRDLIRPTQHGDIWLGLNVLDKEKGYEWSDGSALTYTKWQLNEPNDLNGREKCVEYSRYDMKWNDNNCYRAIAYICKKPKGVEAPSTDVIETTTEIVSCGTDLPWKYYKNYCYYTSSNSFKKTWRSARQFCVQKGADLASIHSEMESNILFTVVSQLDSKAWIGLSESGLDELSHTSYEWSDKTAVNFFNWGSNEPNDANYRATCAAMTSHGGVWHDENCNIELPFVCKRRYSKVILLPTAPTQVAAGGCPPYFLIFGSKCFLIRSTVRYDFGRANDICIQYGPGFNLASINSRLEQMFLVLYMQEAGNSSAFIGLYDLHEDGQYDWLDNTSVSYTNFKAGEPSPHAMEYCVEMFPDGTWNNLNCGSLRGFICQGPRDSSLSEPTPTIPTSHCPAGYTVYSITEQCYRILNSSQSWNESLTLCQADGATLATIADLYDMYFLEILHSTKAPSEAFLWIGLNDFRIRGLFEWISGATVTYTKWNYGEPRLQENMCVAIYKGFWKRVSCDSSHPAICQTVRVQSTEFSRRTTLPSQQVVCSNSSMVSFGTKCYQVVLDLPVDWYTAHDICRDSGMEIASIHSQQESEFIKSLMITRYADSPVKTVWIGLMANQNKRWFFWIDNTPLNFFNWDDNEPNSMTMACAELSALTGSWYDDDCFAKKGYVCKGDPDVFQTTDTSSMPMVSPSNDLHRDSNMEHSGMTLGPGQIVGIIAGISGALVILGVCIYAYVHGSCRAVVLFHQVSFTQVDALCNEDHDNPSVEMESTRVEYDQ